MVIVRRRIRLTMLYVVLFLVVFVVGFLVVRSSTESTSAISIRQRAEFAQKNILFYDPGDEDTCAKWGDVVAGGNTVEEMVLSSLMSYGLTDTQAIGVYANVIHEGGDNPVRHEYKFVTYECGNNSADNYETCRCWSPNDQDGDGIGECYRLDDLRCDVKVDSSGHFDLFQNGEYGNACNAYGVGIIGFSYKWRIDLLTFIQERNPVLIQFFKHPEKYNLLTGNQLVETIGRDNVAKIVALEVEHMMQQDAAIKTVKQLPTGSSVDVAVQTAGIWSDQVEGCNNCVVGGAEYYARQDDARLLYARLHGRVFAGSAGSASLPYCATGKKGTVVELENEGDGGVTEDNFTYYLQDGPSWGYKPYLNNDGSLCYDGGEDDGHKPKIGSIGTSGCGPTAMAMIITALTGKRVTPDEAAETASNLGARACGAGSYIGVLPKIGEKYGLKYEQLEEDVSVSDVEEWLNKGAMILLGVGGEYSTDPYGALANPDGGHIIAIRGRSSDGKWYTFDGSGALVLADNGKPRSDRKYEPEELLKARKLQYNSNNAPLPMYAIYK